MTTEKRYRVEARTPQGWVPALDSEQGSTFTDHDDVNKVLENLRAQGVFALRVRMVE